MFNTYAMVFSITLPQAIQLADRFHVLKLANAVFNTTRRYVQSLSVRIVVDWAGYKP